MGLKSGSRDAELDGEDEQEREDNQSADPDSGSTESASGGQESAEKPAPSSGTDAAPNGSPDRAQQQGDGQPSSADGRPSMDSIPYVLRREKVNEGRQQVPFFLRDEVIEGERGLRDSLEAMLEESVYKSDYREAAMVVAQRNPELLAEILREWGYDLE